MAAMDRATGKVLDGLPEIEQAVDEVLNTIPGDRVMRAEYGSELFELVDTQINAIGRANLARATSEAIRRFEPRVSVRQVTMGASADGVATTTISGVVRATSERISVTR
jgi:phage baseplate assembly protein W